MRVMTRMRHEECAGNGRLVKDWRETRVAFVEAQRASSCIASVSDDMMPSVGMYRPHGTRVNTQRDLRWLLGDRQGGRADHVKRISQFVMAAHTGFVSPIGVGQRSAARPLRQQCRRRLQGLVRARRQTARLECAYGAGAKGGALVDSDGEKRLHVVLVHPQIHWNTGNMGRTCLGLGAVLHLVGPLGFSLDAKQVRRAGLDYWHHVEVYVYESWEQFANGAMQRIGGNRFFFTKFGQQSMAQLVWPQHGKIVMIFGSEVDGFDGIRWWLDGEGRDERTIAFPMVDERFRSFNLSTSASMALWDAYKFTTLNV